MTSLLTEPFSLPEQSRDDGRRLRPLGEGLRVVDARLQLPSQLEQPSSRASWTPRPRQHQSSSGSGTARLKLAREFATRKGWAVADEWIVADDAISGRVSRDGLDRIITAAYHRPRPFDVLVIRAVDRAARDEGIIKDLFEAMHGNGVAIWTYSDGWERPYETPKDRMMVSFEGFSAADYAYQIGQSASRALREKAAKGHSTGQRVYGYAVERKGDHSERVINASEAAVIVRILEMSAAGDGDKRIVNALAAEGTPAPGKGWTKEIVRGILRNPIYDGRVAFGQTKAVVRRDQDGKKREKRVRVPMDDWTWGPAPRIVEHELWQKVQGLKSRQRDRYLRVSDGRLIGKPEATVRAFLNGLAKCGVCGGSMLHTCGKARRYYCVARQR